MTSKREGLSLAGFFQRFPDDQAAEAWFTERRWPNDPECPHCGSTNIATIASRKPMPYRCRRGQPTDSNYTRVGLEAAARYPEIDPPPDPNGRPPMARVSPFHSIKETDGDAYHECTNCVSGRNIKPENKRPGKGGKRQCARCARLIRDGGC